MIMDKLLPNVKSTVLNNGVTVITSAIDSAQSVSFGIFVGNGGRYERMRELGVSHFIEHMLFKGTPSRSSVEISRAIEGRGGYLNAFTGPDDTCYYARMPYECMKLAVEVFCDMYRNSLFDPEELDRERQVILEEIKMYDDQPSSVVQENFEKALFVDHPLGMPLSGDEKTLGKMTSETLKDYMKSHYVPANTVLVFSGRLDHDACVAEAEKWMGDMPKRRPPVFRPVDGRVKQNPLVVERREVAQVQMVLGSRIFGRHDDRRYALRLLNAILGENMSSRLFQSVRERRGLCYSIQTSPLHLEETGIFTVSMGTDSNRAVTALKLVAKELRRIAAKPVSASELKRAKDFASGIYRMGFEAPLSQALYLGEGYLSYGRIMNPEQYLDHIMKVTAEDIMRVADEILEPTRMTLSLVVPKSQPESDDCWLQALQE